LAWFPTAKLENMNAGVRTSAGAGQRKNQKHTVICTSLSGRTCSELAEKARNALAQGTDLLEFRMDTVGSSTLGEIEANLSEFTGRAILAVRSVAEGGRFMRKESERLALIRELSELRPAYFDIELRTLEANPKLASGKLGEEIIVSWHDTVRTPRRADLSSIKTRAASYNGLVKIVATANNATDNLAILSLYDEPGPPPIAFCMGTSGLFSRVMSMYYGSPITYASLPGEPTATGQLPLTKVVAIRRRLLDD
jgi:3-dehydroquinate dehydratase type I